MAEKVVEQLKKTIENMKKLYGIKETEKGKGESGKK